MARLGWQDQLGGRKSGSHVTLVHPDLPNYTWAFADTDELGPKMLARIAKQTGLKPDDL